MRAHPSLVLFLAACNPALLLPDDPAEEGVAVGVQTIPLGQQAVDVWYPAAGPSGTSDVYLSTYLPEAFVDLLDGVELPRWTQQAVPDAPPRRVADPLPLIVFSHGFGGFRAQSTQLTAHLASRGYVVVSTDHPGRDLATLAPCLLTVEGQPCEIGFPGGDDPAVSDVEALLEHLDELPDAIARIVDLERIGMFGHSAGGGTTAAVANQDERITAAMPMAGAGSFSRDLPSAVVGGSCDGIIPPDQLAPQGASAREGYWSIDGAGHLAFSDLCLADLGGLADDLEPLPQANGVFLNALRGLSTDGCPGVEPTVEDATCEDGFPPLDATDPALRYLATAFFDVHLKGVGPGPDPSTYDVIRLLPADPE